MRLVSFFCSPPPPPPPSLFSNIMVDRVTGRVVHIDFGDCFEVAMQRDKFPEKVPFRLTRMLVNAMEVHDFNNRAIVYCTVLYTMLQLLLFIRRNSHSIVHNARNSNSILFYSTVQYSRVGPLDERSMIMLFMCVCVCVFIKLHTTAQSDPFVLVILCHSHVSVCVCVFIKLHITAQSGLVILVILCHSH